LFADEEKCTILDVLWQVYKELLHIYDEHTPEAEKPLEYYKLPKTKFWGKPEQSMYPFILFLN
jgi:hypothetical protein